MRRRKEIVEKFWAKVEKTDCCWNWIGAKNQGFGRFYLGSNVYVPAHFFAWELTHGIQLKRGMLERLCDNPACVKPEHYKLVGKKRKAEKSKAKPAPDAKPAEATTEASAGSVTSGADGQLAAFVFELAKSLKAKTIQDQRVAKALVEALRAQSVRLDEVKRELSALERSVAGLGPPAPASLPTDYGPVLGRIERGLARLAERPPEEVARPQEPAVSEAAPSGPDAAPFEVHLPSLLLQAFCQTLSIPVNMSDARDLQAVEEAFDLALEVCDGDQGRATQTFQSWLSWFANLGDRDGPDGLPPPRTPTMFLFMLRDPHSTRPSPAPTESHTGVTESPQTSEVGA